MVLKNKKIERVLACLPDSPGIYLFYSQKKELVYVGKATSLKSRVKSYFQLRRGVLTYTQSRPIEEMIHEVADIKWKETDSALEAIILEAIYIKKFQPKYNVLGKDSKSWNYIYITNDIYPRVGTIRQHEYGVIASADKYVFGPYPGLNTKVAMKLLRRIFRFSNCVPARQRDLSLPSPRRPSGRGGDVNARPCFYRQMGWCPGVCTGEISPIEYRRQVIRPLATFLRGKKKLVIKMLEKEMKRAGQEERFEDAARLRDQLRSLYRIQDIALLHKSWVENKSNNIIRNDLIRIEGYDISNIGATGKVGSMVVFNEDGPVKSEYRKFIIKTVPGQSDVDSLAEMLNRRLRHAEWPLPTIFLIDGGRPQVNAARRVLEEAKNFVSIRSIPIVGIAKGPERKRNDFRLNIYQGGADAKKQQAALSQWIQENQGLLIRIRDEAHRFAIIFHRQRRGRLFI